jgi:hypothetical protein
VLHLGGNWNNGGNVSLVYSNGNNSPFNTNINIGSRPILKNVKVLLILLLENTITKKMVGS